MNLSWDIFQQNILQLAENIKQSGYQPDMLVAIARGGWIPAVFLSDQLKVKRIASIGLSYADEERSTFEFYSLPSGISGKRVLLIEDRLETAKSLCFSLEQLDSRVLDVKAACLYTRSDSIIIPDFSLGATDQVVKFPWELAGI